MDILIHKRYLFHASVINEAGVGAGSCYDESGSEESGVPLQLLIIYQTCVGLRGDRRRIEVKIRRALQYSLFSEQLLSSQILLYKGITHIQLVRH